MFEFVASNWSAPSTCHCTCTLTVKISIYLSMLAYKTHLSSTVFYFFAGSYGVMLNECLFLDMFLTFKWTSQTWASYCWCWETYNPDFWASWQNNVRVSPRSGANTNAMPWSENNRWRNRLTFLGFFDSEYCAMKGAFLGYFTHIPIPHFFVQYSCTNTQLDASMSFFW